MAEEAAEEEDEPLFRSIIARVYVQNLCSAWCKQRLKRSQSALTKQ